MHQKQWDLQENFQSQLKIMYKKRKNLDHNLKNIMNFNLKSMNQINRNEIWIKIMIKIDNK